MTQSPNRIYSLDVLRGLAAMVVVFGHYHRFFYTGTIPDNLDTISLPFHNFLMFTVNFAFQSVNLFFVLSGFIFYLLYSQKIRDKSISVWDFIILRFSRLYPLHFITLIIMVILQTLIYYSTGSFYIIQFNDIYHFLLNLFFVSGWGFQNGSSFNAVVWSVSIEVLMYGIFFLICWKLHFHPVIMVFFSMIKFSFLTINSDVLRGLFFFFTGGVAYTIYSLFVKEQTTIKNIKGKRKEAVKVQSNLFLYISFIYIAYLWWYAVSTIVYQNQNIQMAFAITDSSTIIIRIFDIFYAVLFSWTIITLAIFESRNGAIGNRFSWLGDISYSTYLWHTPLQVFIMLLFGYFGWGISVFQSGFYLIAYILLLILISLASYHYIEVPLQKILRSKLIKPL